MTANRAGWLMAPSTSLLGRIRYAHKFVVVGLVLLVPLGFLAGAYVSLQRGQVDFSARERVGVAYMSPLTALTTAVVEARHRMVAVHDRTGPDLVAAMG